MFEAPAFWGAPICGRVFVQGYTFRGAFKENLHTHFVTDISETAPISHKTPSRRPKFSHALFGKRVILSVADLGLSF